MYDMAHLREATDAFWHLIRRELGFGPAELTREGDFWDIWQSPDLLLSQTCGYPYRAVLHDKVQLVGTPDYGLPGCPPGYYNSIFIRRRDDTRAALGDFDGARFAYNEALSQSGWAAPVHHMIGTGIRPGTLLETGGHAASFAAVRDGRADFAALDALTLQLLQSSDLDGTGDVVAMAATQPTPALPYITGTARDAEQLRSAISRAIAALPPQMAQQLCLRSVVTIPAQTYLDVPTPPGPDALLHAG
ncbi:hypothetical protein E4Z66_11725 [Aliishimia ponticola]|uniref:Phosphate ABC transporter substrate-binding protein n=2 Tax=Aliishimia ponticola TaxID=2499833 RepID=A0A4S4NJF9_9RHOB|nr:hypothetical protein E4Z66_11725 [Aliishimia ponticola]